MRGRAQIIGAAALAGFVVGPALDQIHVRTETLSYAHPWLWGQAWWVAPQFAIAFAAIAFGSLAILGSRDGSPVAPPSTRRCVVDVAAFLAAYLVTGIWHEQEWLVVAVLGLAWLVRLALDRPDRLALAAMLGLIVGGSAYEATLTSIPETFTYAITSLRTIPAWLPLLYAYAGFAVVSLLRRTAAPLDRRNADDAPAR